MTIRRRVTTCDPERTFRAGPASPRNSNSSPMAPAAGRAPLRPSEPTQKVSDLQRSPPGVGTAGSRSACRSRERTGDRGEGVRPKTPDRTRPGTFNGAIHQPSSCWPADQRSGQAEEGQFALILLTEIELEQPRAVAVVSQPVNLHIGGADDGCELGVGKQQPAEPEPVLADGAIESTVLGRIGGEPVKTPIRIRRLRP
jgi:hypothetical protein